MSNDALETEGASGQAENFNLRIANALKGLLEHRAAEKGLSLNKEIILRLRLTQQQDEQGYGEMAKLWFQQSIGFNERIDKLRRKTQFKLRLPADLKDYLDKTATVNGFSLNQEIAFRLEWTKHQDEQISAPESIATNKVEVCQPASHESPPTQSSRHKSVQFNQRITEAMKAYLTSEAASHGQSVNQEINERLDLSKLPYAQYHSKREKVAHDEAAALRLLHLAQSHWGLSEEVKADLRTVAMAALELSRGLRD